MREALEKLRLRRLWMVAAVVVLAGCADGPAPDLLTASPSLPMEPRCVDVWVDGEVLAEGYEGCVGPGGELVAPATVECVDGGRFTTYADRFFVVLGGRITEAPSDSAAYRQAYEECVGP